MLTENISSNLYIELCDLMGMFRTQSLGDSISVALRKQLQGVKKGSQVLYNFFFLNKGSRQSKHQRLFLRKGTQISSKEFSALLCMGKCKPLGSLNSLLSYAPQLSGAKSCGLFFLTSHISLNIYSYFCFKVNNLGRTKK